MEMARINPQKYVIKPEREGGGEYIDTETLTHIFLWKHK